MVTTHMLMLVVGGVLLIKTDCSAIDSEITKVIVRIPVFDWNTIRTIAVFMYCATTLYCYAWVSLRVPHFLCEVLETESFIERDIWRKMRHRIVPVHDPRPIRDVCIEPIRELLISDPRGPESIKLTDFVPLLREVRDCMSC